MKEPSQVKKSSWYEPPIQMIIEYVNLKENQIKNLKDFEGYAPLIVLNKSGNKIVHEMFNYLIDDIGYEGENFGRSMCFFRPHGNIYHFTFSFDMEDVSQIVLLRSKYKQLYKKFENIVEKILNK